MSPLSFALLLASLSAATPAHAAAKPSDGGLVPREKWLEYMETLLPTIFCKPDGYHRKCSGLSEDACLEEAMRATKSCAIKLKPKVPKQLHQPGDGTKWGEELGKCAGPTLELSLQWSNKWKDSADCKAPPKETKLSEKAKH